MSIVNRSLVKMQSSAAMPIADSTISRACKIGVRDERLGRRGGIRRAGTDGRDAVVGFDHVAFARQDQERFTVADDELGLEPAQIAIGSPFFGQLDGGLAQIAVRRLQLRLEFGEKRERIGNGAGKPGDDRAVVQHADLARPVLEHDVADRHLAVSGHGDDAVAPDAEDRRAANGPGARLGHVVPLGGGT